MPNELENLCKTILPIIEKIEIQSKNIRDRVNNIENRLNNIGNDLNKMVIDLNKK
jgi:hypothetical protein